MTHSPIVQGSGNPHSHRGRRLILLVLVLLTAGGVAWWKLRKPGTFPDPPMPAGVQEEEVLASLRRHRDAILTNPKSADAWGEYAMVLLAQLFDQDADRCFAEASKLDPDNPQWIYGQAQIALKRNPDNALVLLRNTIAAAPRDSQYYSAAKFTLAETLLERGDVEAAKLLFTEELGPPPGNPRSLFGLAQAAVARGDATTATRNLSALLDNMHTRKQATAALARLAREQGDEVAARRYEHQSTEAVPDEAWPDPLLDQTVDLAVGRRARERRIDALERAGMFYAAAQEHLTQLETERTSKDLMGAGVNLTRLGEYDAAFPLLREAAERDPRSPQAHYTLALALFTRAEKEVDRDPTSKLAKDRLREAVEHARKATELKPDHGKAYLFWGLSLKLLGEPKAAIEPFRRGVVATPGEFELHLGLGQVLAATGDRIGAEASFKNAQLINPDDPRPEQELTKLKK